MSYTKDELLEMGLIEPTNEPALQAAKDKVERIAAEIRQLQAAGRPTPQQPSVAEPMTEERLSELARRIALARKLDRPVSLLADEAGSLLRAARELGEMKERNRGGCPCLHTTPCDPRCTCVNGWSSSGCGRCCSYGSKEQQKAAAELIAEAVDAALSPTKEGG